MNRNADIVVFLAKERGFRRALLVLHKLVPELASEVWKHVTNGNDDYNFQVPTIGKPREKGLYDPKLNNPILKRYFRDRSPIAAKFFDFWYPEFLYSDFQPTIGKPRLLAALTF
jgi:hypothetical protein